MTSGFRFVQLPARVTGALSLHSMPGRHEPIEEVWQQIRADGVDLLVCLAGPDEIRVKSPAYATALAAKTVPCSVQSFAVADFGVPNDREAFWSMASDIADRLKAGGRVLIHCGAGIGRTGTLATCVLLALGDAYATAAQVVADAGSHPETAAQRELVSWCATRVRTARP